MKMEMKLNIPQNDYVQLTEVRAEVVQLICDAFLAYSSFKPYDSPSLATLYVDRDTKGFFVEGVKSGVRIRGVEMKAAFDALREAGWHMFQTDNQQKAYICSGKPYRHGWTEVTEFTDFID